MFIVIVIGSVVIVAQTPVNGTWTADIRTGKHDDGDWNGNSYNYSDLQGLTREQAQNGKVNFRLVREAGTIECEGTFTNGLGSGTFTFTPDAGFIGAMKTRGFDFERSSSKHDNDPEERLFAAATLNVTTALCRRSELGKFWQAGCRGSL